MDYIPLSDNAARQLIDSITLFDELRRTQTQARRFTGGMYWKKQPPYEYLVKTSPDNRQHRMGSRSEETKRIYSDFIKNKATLEDRQNSLRAALHEAERMNKALNLETAVDRLS